MLNQIIRYKNVINFIKKNNPNSILEVGSGSKGIGKFMRNLKYTGLDKTTSDYGKQERNTSKNMEFINGDALNMPFKDNTFEFVFCLDMLEHIPKKDRLLVIQEMIRVSKKHIIIGFPFGEFGNILDRLFYQYFIHKNHEIYGRLQEHIDNGIPNEEFIITIKSTLTNIKIKEINNGNIFFLIIVYYLESMRISRFLLSITSHIIRYLPITFNSKYGIRKVLIIEKT